VASRICDLSRIYDTIRLSPWQQKNLVYDIFSMDHTERDWADRVRRFLKAEMKRADVTYAELAKRLEKHGLKETEASIANKLARGTFAATFLLATLAALEMEGIRLEDL
jgi:hypothetical protein